MRFEDVIAWEKEKSHEEGIEEGRREGIEEGRIGMLIEISRKSGLSDEKILNQLMDKCRLTEKEAREYLVQY